MNKAKWMIVGLEALLAIALLAPLAVAGEWKPTVRQPAGGWGFEVTIGYCQDRPTLYAAVRPGDGRDHVYKSLDYGESWVEVFSHPQVYAVRTVPFDPQVVFAGGDDGMGVYRSTNGGFSWEPKNNGISNLNINTIVIAPSNHDVVYAAGGRVYRPGRLYRTSDAGELWIDIYPPLSTSASRITDVAVHPGNENVVFVSCEGRPGDFGIWKSTDGGLSWRHVYDSYLMSCLAISDIDPNVMYAARAWGFYRSTDGGESWTLISYLPSPGETGIHSIALHPANPLLIYVSRKNVGVWASTDGGYTWEQKSTGAWLTDMRVTRLTLDDRCPQNLFSGEYDAGFYRTYNGGEEWKQISRWLPARELVKIAAEGPGGYIWARGFGGITEVSPSGGEDWFTTSPSLGGSSMNELLAPSPDNLIIGYGNVSLDEPGGELQMDYFIYRSTDRGFIWSCVYSNSGDLYGLAYAPSYPNRMYGVAQTGFSYILRSDDCGASWYVPLSGLAYPLHSIAVSSNDPDLLFLGCRDGRFLTSEDGGYSVQQVGSLPGTVSCLAVDPGNDNVIYAGTPVGVYKSDDGGANWLAANSGIEHLGVKALSVDPWNPLRLWVATWGVSEGTGIVHEVYQSYDGAESWLAAKDGMPVDAVVEDFCIGQEDRRIYAATSVGVYLRDLGFLATSSPEATYPNWGKKLARIPWSEEFHAVYTDGNAVRYAYSSDHGETWPVVEHIGQGESPALVLNPGTGGTQLAPWVVYVTEQGDIVRAIRTGAAVWDQAVVFDGQYPDRYAGEPSLAPGSFATVEPTAYVTYPVYTGAPPAQSSILFNAFTSNQVSVPVELDNAPGGVCRSPSVAVTPGDIIHVAWNRGQAIYYRERRGEWSDTAHVSSPVPPITEPANHPAVEAYGEYIYCVWRGPDEDGQFPGDVWQRRRWLALPPPFWYVPENQSRSPGRESDFPVMTTDFVTLWHEEVQGGNSDIWARFAPDPGPRPLFQSGRPSMYPHADGYWESGIARFHCNTVWTEELSPHIPLYEVKFDDFAYVPCVPVDPGAYYGVAVGQPEPSPYCEQRDGYQQQGGFSVDYAATELKYRLPYLNPRRSYALRVVAHQEGSGRRTYEAALDQNFRVRFSVRPNLPETLLVRIPKAAYLRDARVDLSVRAPAGDSVSVAGLKLLQVQDTTPGGGGSQGEAKASATRVHLFQNSPNPFTTRTAIRYQLPGPSRVSVVIFDVSGRLVRELVNDQQEPGLHRVFWNGKDSQGRALAAGVYFYRLQVDGLTETKRAVLAK